MKPKEDVGFYFRRFIADIKAWLVRIQAKRDSTVAKINARPTTNRSGRRLKPWER
jgi:hypothetical protein